MGESKRQSTEAPPHSLRDSCVCVCFVFSKPVLQSHSFARDLEVESKDNDRTKEGRERIFFLCHKEGDRKEDSRGKDGGLFRRVVGSMSVTNTSCACAQPFSTVLPDGKDAEGWRAGPHGAAQSSD